ncbi:MAG: hypothetical protein ACOYIK_09520 [Coriobacteriales bacterium]|jgi:polyphosphate kinase 2 (PPK2 family)
MFEQVNLDEKTDKEYYKEKHGPLLDKLVVLQQQAQEKGLGVVVLFEGWKGAGKGSRIGDLVYKLDARVTNVHSLSSPEENKEREFAEENRDVTGMHPMLQEFWQALGPRGNMTIFDRGWYTSTVRRSIYTDTSNRLLAYAAEIEDFERQLVKDGYIVVKFFIHISKKTQKNRLKELRDNPDTAWRVTDYDLKLAKDYDTFYEAFDTSLRATDFDFAHWTLVNGEDKRTANLLIAQVLVDRIERALAKEKDPEAEAAAAAAAANSAKTIVEGASSGDQRNRSAEEIAAVLEKSRQKAEEQSRLAPLHSRFTIAPNPPRIEDIDHTLTLSREEYDKRKEELQDKLYINETRMYRARIPLMIVYEGDDAAGKGGNIKRVAQGLDARAYTVFPSPAPTKPELMHPFLWRYWTRLPKAGHVGIYDRSWYGRVLVERVEGFASPDEWGRAYDEINGFEYDLQQWGAILLKFWVSVSSEEQLRRFEERETTPSKQWKITDEDWRNRDKAPQYAAAANDMFRLTSTEYAPWHVLESDDKLYARIKGLEIINDAIEKRLKSL